MFQTIINNVLAFIMSVITALTGGTGYTPSMPPQNNSGVITQSRPSPTTNKAPTGRQPDSDGCVYGTPNYWDCKQSRNPIDQKNPTLTPSQIAQAKRDQFNQLVAWRNKDSALRPITYDPSLEATAQRFANELAYTPGDKIWHSTMNTRGRENVAMNPNDYDRFIYMFAGSSGHASTMSTNGKAPKVGIGIAQDPVTGYYYCVQHFADH